MKKWIAILLALVMALSMAACSKETPPKVETEIPATTAPKAPETEATLPTSTPDASADDLEAQIEAYVEATLAALTTEWETLSSGVDSFDAYVEKADAIQAFYEKVLTTSAEICIQMRNYSILCAENILASGKPTDDMYDDMDIVYDLIYDDMGDEIYDGIYDGILDDMYDAFYDEALEDRPDDVEYGEWSDIRSNEYEMWSDARSDTYEHWSDFRSDVYEFWSDVRSELWSDELEGAQEELEDFREDVEKLMGKAAAPAETTPAETTDEPSAESGIRPEFKEAMESYEKFFDEYVAFMKAYKDSDDPLSMMGEYTTMMQQYVETMGELEDIDESELSEEEALYYAEVVLRINQKLLEVI